MHIPFTKIDVPPRIMLGNIIMIVNVISWYTYASAILKNAINTICSSHHSEFILYSILFLSTVTSMMISAYYANKLGNRKYFLGTWILIGAFSSFTLTMLREATIFNVIFLLALIGASFGLGLPEIMALFADATKNENRGRLSSIILLLIFVTVLVLGFLMTANLSLNALILAVWRLVGLASIPLLEDFLENKETRNKSSIALLFKNRVVLLYLIPWAIFSLVNCFSWSIFSRIYGESFMRSSALLSGIISGIFAVVAGFLADSVGRKRILIAGFVSFGIGYAVLGINPYNIYAWHLYTVLDGISWGILSVIFLFTIWGDLSDGKSRPEYYAVGFLPYALSGFVQVTLGPLMAEVVPAYAILSFAAFFLFLAIFPLMYAPETLPENVFRERELRGYIEKAKRVREKFT